MKGQTAMEYLMTYGWAILIILVVGAVLFIYVSPGKLVGTNIVGFSNVKVIQQTYNAAGTMTLQIENRVPEQINVTKVFDTTDGVLIDITDVTLPTGGRATVTGATGKLGLTGDAYQIDLALEYVSSLGSINSTGTISGTRS